MSELGISDEQFVAACQKAEANPIHKKIVDQIMAVDSFLAFKRLMVKRNNELNKQAMELYEKATAAKNGTNATATTATGMPKDTTTENAPPISEEEKKKQAAELREVMRVAHSLERAEEEEMMKRAMEESERHKTEAEKAQEEEEAMIK